MLLRTWQTYFSLVGIIRLDVFLVAPGDQSQLSIQRSSANQSSASSDRQPITVHLASFSMAASMTFMPPGRRMSAVEKLVWAPAPDQSEARSVVT